MIELKSGGWTVACDPERGGGLVSGRFNGHDILRPADADHHSFAPLQLASFPLIPFSNRIQNGRFTFRGKSVCLPQDLPGEPNAIHGHGWLAPWEVEAASSERLSLTYRHAADAWPWAYSAQQIIHLNPAEMRLDLCIVNDSEDAMPAGLGFHPYLVRTPGCEIRFRAGRVWVGPDHGIPAEALRPSGDFDFSSHRRPGGQTIDHCYAGWDGRADIDWPELGLALTMSAGPTLRHLVAFIPEQAEYFCLEPVSNMNDAVNWLDRSVDTGIRILEPGGQLTGTVSFRIRAL